MAFADIFTGLYVTISGTMMPVYNQMQSALDAYWGVNQWTVIQQAQSAKWVDKKYLYVSEDQPLVAYQNAPDQKLMFVGLEHFPAIWPGIKQQQKDFWVHSYVTLSWKTADGVNEEHTMMLDDVSYDQKTGMAKFSLHKTTGFMGTIPLPNEVPSKVKLLFQLPANADIISNWEQKTENKAAKLLASLRVELVTTEKKLAVVEQNLMLNQKQQDVLRQNMKTFKLQVEQSQGELLRLQSSWDDLKMQNNNLSRQKLELEKIVAFQEETIDRLQKNIESLEADVETLTQRLVNSEKQS